MSQHHEDHGLENDDRANATPPSACCAQTELSTCCKPGDKASCCGPAPQVERAPSRCGCRQS
jgi:hypothetical protein